MTKAANGDAVSVHYTGKLDDGTVFDSSRERDPLDLTIGEGKVIPGFEQAIIGMSPGDTTETKIPADQAYGPYHDDLVIEVDKDDFSDGTAPEIGQCYRVPRKDGGSMIVTVTKVEDAKVTIDANHPLAGKDLTFEIELVSVG